ncbi:hypothetical protein EK21DRAFT_115700 [Setomelanomma holmii]|uniref:Uncharacterized protein n=1 Tax=Setomelanomma holmii TaxID=210430 RepID=A0A9P4LH97_9PLEO|nr:hypothetical protein EK21DRAFT_115700 [Setomelanomma holmii]
MSAALRMRILSGRNGINPSIRAANKLGSALSLQHTLRAAAVSFKITHAVVNGFIDDKLRPANKREVLTAQRNDRRTEDASKRRGIQTSGSTSEYNNIKIFISQPSRFAAAGRRLRPQELPPQAWLSNRESAIHDAIIEMDKLAIQKLSLLGLEVNAVLRAMRAVRHYHDLFVQSGGTLVKILKDATPHFHHPRGHWDVFRGQSISCPDFGWDWDSIRWIHSFMYKQLELCYPISGDGVIIIEEIENFAQVADVRLDMAFKAGSFAEQGKDWRDADKAGIQTSLDSSTAPYEDIDDDEIHVDYELEDQMHEAPSSPAPQSSNGAFSSSTSSSNSFASSTGSTTSVPPPPSRPDQNYEDINSFMATYDMTDYLANCRANCRANMKTVQGLRNFLNSSAGSWFFDIDLISRRCGTWIGYMKSLRKSFGKTDSETPLARFGALHELRALSREVFRVIEMLKKIKKNIDVSPYPFTPISVTHPLITQASIVPPPVPKQTVFDPPATQPTGEVNGGTPSTPLPAFTHQASSFQIHLARSSASGTFKTTPARSTTPAVGSSVSPATSTAAASTLVSALAQPNNINTASTWSVTSNSTTPATTLAAKTAPARHTLPGFSVPSTGITSSFMNSIPAATKPAVSQPTAQQPTSEQPTAQLPTAPKVAAPQPSSPSSATATKAEIQNLNGAFDPALITSNSILATFFSNPHLQDVLSHAETRLIAVCNNYRDVTPYLVKFHHDVYNLIINAKNAPWFEHKQLCLDPHISAFRTRISKFKTAFGAFDHEAYAKLHGVNLGQKFVEMEEVLQFGKAGLPPRKQPRARKAFGDGIGLLGG